jgi:hypothetical protein
MASAMKRAAYADLRESEDKYFQKDFVGAHQRFLASATMTPNSRN